MSGGLDPRIAKLALRRQLREARQALSLVQRQAEAKASCAMLAEILGDRPLVAYWALAEELSLGWLIRAQWRAGHEIWLPRVSGPGALTWHPILAASQLCPDRYGIQAPNPEVCPVTDLPSGALMLVPGVGFTPQGHRLGMGGGFYDRYLAQAKALHCERIGVGFSCQLVASVPLEAHDQAVDRLLIGGEWIDLQAAQ